LWGEPAQGACQRSLLARDVLRRGGNPPAPACPPKGETGKGEIQIPCCRRLFLPPCRPASRVFRRISLLDSHAVC
jgi:hypothetical protein